MRARQFTKAMGWLSAGLVLCLATACRGSAPEEVSALPADEAWQFTEHRDHLVEASCHGEEARGFAQSFRLEAQPVMLGTAEQTQKALSGVSFEGGWSLQTEFASFGGLSGLKVLPSGDLLAVSDGGALVEIGFDQKLLEPTGQATLTFLKDESGSILTGKSQADSEGLEYIDGLAFVSFERDHRILAYGYGVCGGNARGIEVSAIGTSPESLAGTIRGNGGAEALMLEDDRLIAGLEDITDRLSPVAVIDEAGEAQFAARPWIDGGDLPLVGFDRLEATTYSLHRAWNPVTGNSIMLGRVDETGRSVPLVRLSRPLSVDNFEGVATAYGPDGAARLFIIADDNFSDGQQTLLFVFRVEP
ncbi:esterase-like activity of phytase family protein [Henriciella sp.]|uniref:esterase-like activity of phytase family protein n=1 Tax=Henriciella sp. TaxID=1968823 RepID=UPI0026272B92|nr:esterase-like activity of phytase family protein [Henriciella sp.]